MYSVTEARLTNYFQSNYVPLANLLGLFGQIRDDLMNLQSAEVNICITGFYCPLFHTMEQYTSKKGFADDLTEGKFSFPVIHAIHADTSNKEILSALPRVFAFFTSTVIHPKTVDVLQQRPSTPTLKIHTIDYLKNHTKSLDYTLSVLDTLETQMRLELQRLGGNPGLEKLIDMLHVDASKLS